eukprot:6175638-Alexandrium_andersonii.AAC.1
MTYTREPERTAPPRRTQALRLREAHTDETAAGRARGVARFAMVAQRQPTDLAGGILVGRETAAVLRI